MIKFRVYFAHGPAMIVEAESGIAARNVAAGVAKKNGTLVTKVKRAKDQ